MDKYLGLDLGTTTLGISICNELGLIFGVENFNFERGNYKKAREHLITIIKKEKIKNIVIGYPITLKDTEETRCKSVNRFIDDLKKELNEELNIYFEDERYSTIEARERMENMFMKKSKQDELIDMFSAIIILERYMRRQKDGQN